LVTRAVARIPRPTVPAVPVPRVRLRLPLVGRLRGREARRRRLLVEALAVLLVTAAAAGAVYVFGVSSVDSPWHAAATGVQNISHAPGAQTEVSASADPSNPAMLISASNDTLERTLRIYSSTDGGSTWSDAVAPYLGLDDCARGDPSREKAWFSCSVSRDGKTWKTPVRTTKVSASQQVLIEDARIYGFGDFIGYGGYPALVVAGTEAYPFWIDTRDLGGRRQEVFGARLSLGAFR
jgi:hypothetical protein